MSYIEWGLQNVIYREGAVELVIANVGLKMSNIYDIKILHVVYN